jgi:hypothetical protein
MQPMIRALLIGVCVILCVSNYGQAVPDVVLVHRQLFDADANAHAVAIRGDRIIAVGTDDSIRQHIETRFQ